MTSRTLIIAEAGVNHNGDLGLAMRLIDVAAEAGADIVKFQTFSADRIVTSIGPEGCLSTAGERRRGIAVRNAPPAGTHGRHAQDACGTLRRSRDPVSVTGFDVESVDLLVSLGQRLFKIPSGEITNLPYLRRCRQPPR
jgi:N,N'-diacetyllegionaminate synthase